MYISLGVDCGPGRVLTYLKLRQVSLPFDWVVTYKGVCNIIENDFADFLPTAENNYETMNKKNGVLFLHENFPESTEKMTRRVERFKNILATSSEKLIFVRKSHGQHNHCEHGNIVVDDIDDMIKLDELLAKKYPLLDYEINLFLICDNCYSNLAKEYKHSDKLKIHNIARPYPPNVNMTFPYYFEECVTNLFCKKE
jgi:hypothetical protein